jgi:hypothetical protein
MGRGRGEGQVGPLGGKVLGPGERESPRRGEGFFLFSDFCLFLLKVFLLYFKTVLQTDFGTIPNEI